VFVPGRPFQPSPMFSGKARILPYRGAPERYTTIIRLDGKVITGTSTLAYKDHS